MRLEGGGARATDPVPAVCNVIPWQNHTHKFQRLVEHVRAFGAPNNDTPEALPAGLALAQTGCGGHWRPLSAKLVVLITDAPPHGSSLYSTQCSYDAFPNGDPTGLDPLSQVNQLAADGVTMYTIGVEPAAQRDGADTVLRSFALHGGGQHVVLDPVHHENLHHFIAAAGCDLVVRAVAAQELQEVALRQGLSSLQQLSPQLRASVVNRVALRLKTRMMPRFTFSEPVGRRSTASTRNLPVVTGFQRTAMTDNDIAGYVDGVIAQPPRSVPFAGANYASPAPGASLTGAAVAGTTVGAAAAQQQPQMSHWVTQGTGQQPMGQSGATQFQASVVSPPGQQPQYAAQQQSQYPAQQQPQYAAQQYAAQQQSQYPAQQQPQYAAQQQYPAQQQPQQFYAQAQAQAQPQVQGGAQYGTYPAAAYATAPPAPGAYATAQQQQGQQAQLAQAGRSMLQQTLL